MACQYSTADIVQRLLNRNGDVKNINSAKESALHLAARNDNKEEVGQIAKMLLNHSADIWAKATLDHTPLHYAASWGCKEMVDLLLEKDPSTYIPDCDNWTPLHQACYKGFGDVVQLLLDKGADHTLKTSDTGQDALTMAVQFYANFYTYRYSETA
ncbi:ankyrin, partial [Aspergillus steynii IBT 23096]